MARLPAISLFFLLLVLLVVLLAAPPGTEAIYADKSFYLKSYITVFQKFGFEVNGTFAITGKGATFDPPEAKKSIFFYLCDSDQWRSLYMSGDVKQLCSVKQLNSSAHRDVCELSHLSFSDARLRNYTVRGSSLYYFIALRCLGASSGSISGEASSEERKRDAYEAYDAYDHYAYNNDASLFSLTAVVNHLARDSSANDDDDNGVVDGHHQQEARHHQQSQRLKNDKYLSGFSIDVVEMSLTYTLLNPGGRHLSVGNAPLPALYSVLVAWWSWLTLMYGLVLFVKQRHRTFSLWTPPGWGTVAESNGQEQVVPLHWVLELVVVTKLVVEVSGMFYWRLCDRTGICYTQLAYLQSFVYALSESLLFAVLLLVAKGWKITRWGLPLSEVRSITVALLLLLSTLVFFSLYNESYYFFSLLIMYIFMLPKIFAAIGKNLKRLTAQLAFVSRIYQDDDYNSDDENLRRRRPPNLPRLSALRAKLRLFRCLKVAVGLYVTAFVVLSLLRMGMPWRLHWLDTLLQELAGVLIVGVIIYLLAPNPAIFARANVLDELSLPWFHRAVLHRLLLDGADAVPDDENDADVAGGDEDPNNGRGLMVLVNGHRRRHGPAPPARVDFGEGHVCDLPELVVFEFPRDDGGARATEDDDDHHHQEEEEETDEAHARGQPAGTAVSARYLAVGAPERFVDRKAAAAAARAAAKVARKERRRKARQARAAMIRSLASPATTAPDTAGPRDGDYADTWQARRRRQLQSMQQSDGSEEVDDEVEAEVEHLWRRRRATASEDGGEEGGIELVVLRPPSSDVTSNDSSNDEDEEDIHHDEADTNATTSRARAGEEDDDDQDDDVEKGVERRALLTASSASSPPS